MKISGNTILITGGSTGIGLALAEAFLKEGNDVIICSRNEEKLDKAKDKFPALHTKVCDVSIEADRKSLFTWINEKFSNLNILVNNAGIQRDIDFTSGISEYQSGENEIAINLEAPIILTGVFIPFLAAKKEPAIINVTSGLGFIPAARVPVYSATKAAMHAFTMALRFQLAKKNIKVYEIIPPAVDTELNPEGRAKRGNYKAGLTPEQFVAKVIEDLKNDKTEIGYGMTADIMNASKEELDKRFQMMNSRW